MIFEINYKVRLMEEINNVDICECIQSDINMGYTLLYNASYNIVMKNVLDNSGTYEDAQDIFQDAILVIREKINKTKNTHIDNKQLCSLLIAIARNMWLQKLREKKYTTNIDRTNIAAEQSDDNTYSVDAGEEDELKYKMMTIVWNKMKPTHREVITAYMNYKDGFTCAEKLKCNYNSFRKMLFVARKKFKELLMQEPNHDKYFSFEIHDKK